MNNYFIAYKIATVAKLEEEFDYKGYHFSSYDPQYWKSDSWVASKTIQTKNPVDARVKFVTELIPLVHQFSVISQCAFRFSANSYIIYKLNNNPEKIFYIYFVRKTGSVGLHFDQEHIDQLPKFNKIKNQAALLYIMEAANVTTFYAKLSMLIMAAEGLAGEIVVNNQIITDKAELKRIVGEELFNKLFPYGVGLRNVLFHGKVTDHGKFEGLVDEIYKGIRSYLSSEYDINLSGEVVHPQRNPNDNFESTASWEAFKDEPVLNMKIIEEAFDDNIGTGNPQQIFEWRGNPDNY